MSRSLAPRVATLLLIPFGAVAADTSKVVLDPRVEAHSDGTRELVIDARIEPGWILYASDFEQPQIGPRAARVILAGEADIAICGGAEAWIGRVSLGGLAAARALSSGFNDTPERASRPFDQDRDGFVMGEGAGIMVIETLEHALARGAKPIVELVGYGTTSDAYHLTAGPDDGSGARRAMEIALAQAGITPDQVDHINAHATSTQVGDRAELAAMRALFGSRSDLLISATKSSTGHLLGAAGGIEAIFTVLALRDQVAPATLNLLSPDPLAEGLSIVTGEPRHAGMTFALTNGFGFGGVNASAVFRRL